MGLLSEHLLLILVVRISSVFLVQTWFVPDEYWQSLEIAHWLSFGYGYLTWEWFEGIRSLIYPLFIAIVFKHLENFKLDSRLTLIFAPRILQALFTALSERVFIKALKTRLSSDHIKWLTFFQLGSYFMYYMGSRTLGNTIEMNVVLLGIACYFNGNNGYFFMSMAISIYMRPTCVPLWLPIFLKFVFAERKWIYSYKCLYAVSKCVLILGILIGLDSWWYGKLTLVPVQFLLFNFVNNFSQFYGEHSWHWYLTNALPSLMGPMLFPIANSILSRKEVNNKTGEIALLLQLSVASYVIFHSLVGHKEIRFMTPVVPLLNVLAVLSVTRWSSRWRKLFIVLFFMYNLPATWYLSFRHQRGVLDAVNFLATRIEPHDSVLFLMPCHSTPFYGHIHVNSSMKFLTCPPNLSNQENYVDEADVFYHHPAKWLLTHASTNPPNYLVLFDELIGHISNYLISHNYRIIGNFFHCDMDQGRVGKRVLVFFKETYR